MLKSRSQMKNSGVKEIGSIPQEWKCVKIARIIENSAEGIMVGPFGSSLTGAVVGEADGKYKVYGQANLIRRDFDFGDKYVNEEKYKELIRYKVIPGDVAISMMGTVGKCRVIPDGIREGIMDSHLIKARLSVHMLPEYFEYIYESSAVLEQIMAKSTGTIMTGLNSGIVKSLYVVLPPLPEQHAIASYLDDRCSKLDEIITEAEKSIEEYKELKQAVIFEAVTKGLDKNVPMRDSGVEWIGKTPDNWTVLSLRFLCEMQAGKNLVSEEIAESGDYPVYGGNGLRGYYSEFNTEGPHLLVGRQGALCGNIHSVDGQYWCTEHAVVTTPSSLVTLDYLYFLLVAMDLNQYASNTAAQPGLSVNKIIHVKTVIPGLREQRDIVEYLENKIPSIDALISEKQSLIEDLKAYKKSLIYEVVTGKRRIS